MRLGLLQSSNAIDRQATREAAEAQSKKNKRQVPTVKTEEQTKADETAAARQKEKAQEPPKPPPIPRIRPLSEAKAIDMGANFISESFLFLVAGGLIVFESMRSRRKESNRREDVADRLGELEESENAARIGLVALEHEVIRLRAQLEKRPRKEFKRILPKEIWEEEKEEEPVEPPSLLSRISGMFGWAARGGNSDNTTTSNPTAASNSQDGPTPSASTKPTSTAGPSTSSSQK